MNRIVLFSLVRVRRNELASGMTTIEPEPDRHALASFFSGLTFSQNRPN
jgi:hypothetical protein